MNNDLISREALRKAFHERIYYFNKSSWDEANAIIDNAPTVARSCKKLQEVANERPQGEWIDGDCSVCGHSTMCDGWGNDVETAFCPKCGAYMRGKEK